MCIRYTDEQKKLLNKQIKLFFSELSSGIGAKLLKMNYAKTTYEDFVHFSTEPPAESQHNLSRKLLSGNRRIVPVYSHTIPVRQCTSDNQTVVAWFLFSYFGSE
jgi:hypothetical protein